MRQGCGLYNDTVPYLIHRVTQPPPLDGDFSAGSWADANTLDVANFHERSGEHHPRVQARVLYGNDGLYVGFHVNDQYVRCVTTEFQGPVCQDSCVEFFVEPAGTPTGYFNFEINCGGTMLLHFVRSPEPTNGVYADYDEVSAEAVSDVRIVSTMPQRVDPEIAEPTDWTLQYFVPFTLFERYKTGVGRGPGVQWRANFYKCADRTSHPHWASWSPVTGELSFHKPDCFDVIEFA